MKKTKILIVDDDPLIRELLQEYLQKNHYQVLLAENKQQAYQQINHKPAMVLLDISLPDGNGLDITQYFHQAHPSIPIILISAKGDDQDIISGLKHGADDYLPKPFNPLELLLRIKAILRRINKVTDDSKSYQFGDFSFDMKALKLTTNKQLIKLTRAEKNLLAHFIKHPNQCLNREQLLNAIATDTQDSFDRSIDIHITRLRKKIETDAKKPRWIITEWGLGYTFCPDKENT